MMGVWGDTFNRKLVKGHDHGSAALEADKAEARVLSRQRQTDLALAVEIIQALTDEDPCRLDHNGNCQAHMTFGEGECPHAMARRWLESQAS